MSHSSAADWINRAAALLQQSKFQDAIAACDAALALAPTDPRALNNKALALNSLNMTAEALACFDAALAAAPDHVSAWVNRGATLLALGRDEDAIASMDRAIALNPNNAGAHYYRGLALYPLGRGDEALASFDKSIALTPDDADARYSKGVALLAMGDLRAGWPLFEERWRARRVRQSPSQDRGEPRWNSEGLEGPLRIWAEQGIGDQILFSSLVPLARERTDQIAVECDPRLAPLLSRAMPNVAVNLGKANAAQIAFGSLGQALGVDAATLARRPAPYLVADPRQRVATRTRYEALVNGRPIIGISWFSQNPEFGAQKSTSLEDWEPLLRRDCLFVNVQYHSDPQAIAAAERAFGCAIHTDPHIDQVRDLDAFAAQIAALDGMVSVSNSGVHMAGALGVPCVVVVPRGRGLLWYWGVEGETTPWYESVRIVRRDAREPWSASVERAADRLERLLGER